MSSFQTLVIESPLTAVGFKSVCNLAPGKIPAVVNFENYLGAVVGGNQSAKLTWEVGAVKASGTITQATTGAANAQTLTILGVTFTALTSGHVAAAATWNRNNTVATSAANLAASINEYVLFSGVLVASAAAGVVTVTCVVPGLIGNSLVIANVDCANTTVVSLAGGLGGTQYSQDLL